MSTYISAANIIGTNLHAPNAPKEITSPPKEGKPGEKYTRTYLSYNYGTPEKPYLSEALFELQICKGTVKRNSKGAIKLNLRIKDQQDLAGLAQLGYGFAIIVDKYKNRFGLRSFTPDHPGDLRGAFFHAASEDGQIIEGSDPIVSLKMNEKTVFKVIKPKLHPETKQPIILEGGYPDIEEERVDYKSLENKTIDCSVVFNARDLYRSSGTPLPQMFVRSCMVLSITDNGEVEHTKSQMVQQYLQQNPELLNTLAEQIAKLKVGATTSTSLLDTVANNNSTNLTPSGLPPVQTPATNQSTNVTNQQPTNQNPTQASLPQMTIPIVPQFNQTAPMSPAPIQSTMPQFPQQGLGTQLPTSPQGGIDLTQFLNQQQNQPGNNGITLNRL